MAVAQVGQNGNTSIYVGTAVQDRMNQDQTGKAGTSEKGNIFAGNTLLGDKQEDTIAMRKNEAQKSALKKINDVISGHQKMEESINEMKDSQKEMLQIAGDTKEQIDFYQQKKQDLMENYNVDPEGKEQKDLELLEKSLDFSKLLTDEEREQLKDIGELTDYQKEALEIDGYLNTLEKKRQGALQGYEAIQGGIIDTELEELKDHSMVDAQKEAAKIMQTAAKEAAFMLLQEAKDHIDEELKEKKEEIEKAKEEKEEREENIENKETTGSETESTQTEKTESVASSEQIVDIPTQDATQERMVQEIKEIVKQHKLLEEDLMGIKVDSLI